jgi:hypothetical protein
MVPLLVLRRRAHRSPRLAVACWPLIMAGARACAWRRESGGWRVAALVAGLRRRPRPLGRGRGHPAPSPSPPWRWSSSGGGRDAGPPTASLCSGAHASGRRPLVILPLALAPGQRGSQPACDAFSLVSVALTAARGVVAARGWNWPSATTLTGPRRASSSPCYWACPCWSCSGCFFPHCLARPLRRDQRPRSARLIARPGNPCSLGPWLSHEPVTAALPAGPAPGGAATRRRAGLALGRAADSNLWLALGVLVGGWLILPWWQFRGGHLANVYATLSLHLAGRRAERPGPSQTPAPGVAPGATGGTGGSWWPWLPHAAAAALAGWAEPPASRAS